MTDDYVLYGKSNCRINIYFVRMQKHEVYQIFYINKAISSAPS